MTTQAYRLKTVYVIGAGFSKEAGYPLTREFTYKTTINNFRKNLKKKEISRMENVTSYFLDRIKQKYCKNDIEDVLNHLSVAEYLDMASTTEFKSKLYLSSNIYMDLIWYIVKILQWKSKQKIPKEYFQFVKNIYENGDSIISFNYDMLIETVLRELDIVCDYGFNQKPIKNAQMLLKMHGSVNWSQCINCEYIALFSDNISVKILSGNEKCPNCKKAGLAAVIVPPVLYKENYFRNSELVKTVWGHANEILSKAKKIVFIGFSMRTSDYYAQELFKLSSNMNRTKIDCLIVTKPKSKDEMNNLRKRYREILVRDIIKTKQMKFTKFVQRMN